MQKEKRVALEERKAAEKNAPEGRAYLKYARISPRKVEIVLNLIRGKDTDTAMAILKNTPKSASEYLLKLLNKALDDDTLRVLNGVIHSIYELLTIVHSLDTYR